MTISAENVPPARPVEPPLIRLRSRQLNRHNRRTDKGSRNFSITPSSERRKGQWTSSRTSWSPPRNTRLLARIWRAKFFFGMKARVVSTAMNPRKSLEKLIRPFFTHLKTFAQACPRRSCESPSSSTNGKVLSRGDGRTATNSQPAS